MKFAFLVTLLLLTANPLTAYSQRENSVWDIGFGRYVFNDTSYSFHASCGAWQFGYPFSFGQLAGDDLATISDRHSGKELFAAVGMDGIISFSQCDTMRGGRLYGWTHSDAYHAVGYPCIVPVPLSESRFYVLYNTVDYYYNNSRNGILRYAIVDMDSSNGAGAVVIKDVPLGPSYYWGFFHAIRHENKRDYWLIADQMSSVRPYLITPFGIVKSSQAYTDIAREGPTNMRAVSNSGRQFLGGQMNICHFDRALGQLSPYTTISDYPNFGWSSFSAFSPNDSFLYLGEQGGSNWIYQFDLRRIDPHRTDLPYVFVHDSLEVGEDDYAYLGGDGRIYGTRNEMVKYPDREGLACVATYHIDSLMGPSVQLQNICLTDIQDTDRGYSHSLGIRHVRVETDSLGSTWRIAAVPELNAVSQWSWQIPDGHLMSSSGNVALVRYPDGCSIHEVRLRETYASGRVDSLQDFIIGDSMAVPYHVGQSIVLTAALNSTVKVPLTLHFPLDYYDGLMDSINLECTGFEVHLSFDTSKLHLPISEIASRVLTPDSIVLQDWRQDSDGVYLHFGNIICHPPHYNVPLGSLSFDCSAFKGDVVPINLDYATIEYFQGWDTIDQSARVVFPIAQNQKSYAVLKVEAASVIQDQGSPTNALWPNPCDRSVEIAASTSSFKFDVLDILGRSVFSGSSVTPSVSFDVSSLIPGTYLVRIEGNDGGGHTKRLSVQH